MRLHHLHLPGLTPYPHASHLQSLLLRPHLLAKSLRPSPSTISLPPPAPSLLTFQTPPTYTCGRRETTQPPPEQLLPLLASGLATYHPSPRGGQTTFHGPGQLTAYLICSLKQHSLPSPRAYVRFLEDCLLATCAHYGLRGIHTDEANPGLWTAEGPRGERRKIASVGVHMRRWVASHGVSLNVGVDLASFDRIVMCGLPGKRATNFEREGVRGKTVDEVAEVFAEVVGGRLKGVQGVEKATEGEVLGEAGGEGDLGESSVVCP